MSKSVAELAIKITTLLKIFPEVNWDRWSGELEDLTVFGWIKREDTHEDYVELSIENGEPISISTSSAKYSAKFCERLEFTHSDCKRVENYFNIPNVIRLTTTNKEK